jgi:hypothetical protein
LKRNRQFYRLLAEEITIRLPAPPITNGNNYEKTFALKLFSVAPHHYHFNTTSDKIYMTDKPVGDRNHEVLGMGSFGEYTLLYTGIK